MNLQQRTERILVPSQQFIRAMAVEGHHHAILAKLGIDCPDRQQQGGADDLEIVSVLS